MSGAIGYGGFPLLDVVLDTSPAVAMSWSPVVVMSVGALDRELWTRSVAFPLTLQAANPVTPSCPDRDRRPPGHIVMDGLFGLTDLAWADIAVALLMGISFLLGFTFRASRIGRDTRRAITIAAIIFVLIVLSGQKDKGPIWYVFPIVILPLLSKMCYWCGMRFQGLVVSLFSSRDRDSEK